MARANPSFTLINVNGAAVAPIWRNPQKGSVITALPRLKSSWHRKHCRPILYVASLLLLRQVGRPSRRPRLVSVPGSLHTHLATTSAERGRADWQAVITASVVAASRHWTSCWVATALYVRLGSPFVSCMPYPCLTSMVLQACQCLNVNDNHCMACCCRCSDEAALLLTCIPAAQVNIVTESTKSKNHHEEQDTMPNAAAHLTQ